MKKRVVAIRDTKVFTGDGSSYSVSAGTMLGWLDGTQDNTTLFTQKGKICGVPTSHIKLTN